MFIIIFSLAGLLFYIFLAYIYPALHRNRVANQEMPESWERVLNEQVAGFTELLSDEQEKVRRLLKVYMAEKFLEPDELKWDEQILIFSHVAMAMRDKRSPYLKKLSTIKIGPSENFGQGLLEVTSIEKLKTIDFKRWS